KFFEFMHGFYVTSRIDSCRYVTGALKWSPIHFFLQAPTTCAEYLSKRISVVFVFILNPRIKRDAVAGLIPIVLDAKRMPFLFERPHSPQICFCEPNSISNSRRRNCDSFIGSRFTSSSSVENQ